MTGIGIGIGPGFGAASPTDLELLSSMLAGADWEVLSDSSQTNVTMVDQAGTTGFDGAADYTTKDPYAGLLGWLNTLELSSGPQVYPSYTTSVSDQVVMIATDSYGANGGYTATDGNAQFPAHLAEIGRLQMYVSSTGGHTMAQILADYQTLVAANPTWKARTWIVMNNNGGASDSQDMTDLATMYSDVTTNGGKMVIVGMAIAEGGGNRASRMNPDWESTYPTEYVDTQDAANVFPDSVHPNEATAKLIAQKIWTHMQGRSLGLTWSNQTGVDPISGGIVTIFAPSNWGGSPGQRDRSIIFTTSSGINHFWNPSDEWNMQRGSAGGAAVMKAAATGSYATSQDNIMIFAHCWRGFTTFGQVNGIKQANGNNKACEKWDAIDGSTPLQLGVGNINQSESRAIVLVKKGTPPTDAELTIINNVFNGNAWDNSNDNTQSLWDSGTAKTGYTFAYGATGDRHRVTCNSVGAGLVIGDTGFSLAGSAAWEVRTIINSAGNRTVRGWARADCDPQSSPLTQNEVVAIYGNNGQIYNNDGGTAFHPGAFAGPCYHYFEWNASTLLVTVYHKTGTNDSYTLIGTFDMDGLMGTAGSPIVWYPMCGTTFTDAGQYELGGEHGGMTYTQNITTTMRPLLDV